MMRKRGRGAWVGLCAIMLLSAGSAMAQSQSAAPAPGLSELAKRFGARPLIRDISLSPDGRRIALIENAPDGTEMLATVDLEASLPPKSIMASPGKNAHLEDCFWPTNSRLICTVRDAVDEVDHIKAFTRLFTLNADGTDLKLLTTDTNERSLFAMQSGGEVIDQTGGKPGSILITRQFIPEETAGSHLANAVLGLGVEQIDVTSLVHTTVVAPHRYAARYITDGQGHVRLRGDVPDGVTGYSESYIDWFYRKPGLDEWLPLGRQTNKGGRSSGFNPVTVDPKLNVVYGFDDQDGRRAIFRIKLDGSNTRELVAAEPTVDVNELIIIGRQRRVVGAAYATDQREAEFFDPEFKALNAAISKALAPGTALSFVDYSADENQLLVLGASNTNPGQYYRFDKTAHRLEEVLPVRPDLRNTPLAPTRAINFTARDGSLVPAYLTLPLNSTGKGLPAIVMPHGGPGARDVLGFDWLAQFFAARGFAVIQPNFRGSAGYGEAWFEQNGFQSWRAALGDVDDAGKWLVSQGIADPSKLAIVGWSYGGYAALQSGVFEPGLFKAIVAIAPVTDLDSLVFSRLHFMDYERTRAMVGTGPHLKEGSPAQNPKAFVAPVLLFHGTVDENVPVDQSRMMRDKLKAAGKPVDYVEFPGLNHQLDTAAARATLLTRADGFLRQSMGMPALP